VGIVAIVSRDSEKVETNCAVSGDAELREAFSTRAVVVLISFGRVGKKV
jgi:hypothetical protein